MTVNRSGRSFAEELAAFERWFEPTAPVRAIRAVAYDYTRADDWSFLDAPEVDGDAFDAILRSATRGWVCLSAVAVQEDLLTVALEFFADPDGRELPSGASVSVDWIGGYGGTWPARLETLGMAVLAAKKVPAPPSRPAAVGVAYPVAFDIAGTIAAVSFVALNVYPEHLRWWCLVEQFWLDGENWVPAGGSYDNTTTDTPFARPTRVENSVETWVDWITDGGHGGWDVEPRERHSYCGIAPTHTARLTVTTPDGLSRSIAVNPLSGAWVVVAPGTRSTLTGYDAAGVKLGTTEFGQP